jgi:hypothetical protein
MARPKTSISPTATQFFLLLIGSFLFEIRGGPCIHIARLVASAKSWRIFIRENARIHTNRIASRGFVPFRAGACEMAWHGHLAPDSLGHFKGHRPLFTGKMPVPRLKTSVSQQPLWIKHPNRHCNFLSSR